MNLEQTLADELRSVATGVHAPPPPRAVDLARAADRAHRRRAATRLGLTGLVAAAVVAAVVLGTQVGRPDAAPSPANPTPTATSTSYYAPGVPYLHEGGLYIDHQRQPGEWLTVQSYGEHTIALAADSTATILRDGKKILHVDGLVQVVSLSFDGTKAAWLVTDDRGEKGTLVVRDLAASRDLVRLPLDLRQPSGDNAFGFSLTVRDDGTAYYEVGSDRWELRPGTSPVRTTAEPSFVLDHPPGFAGVTSPVTLSPDHLWGAWVTDPDGREPVGSDGSALGLTIQKPDRPGSRFTIPVPRGVDVAPMAFWVSPTTVNLAGTDQVNCDVVTKRCRVVDAP